MNNQTMAADAGVLLADLIAIINQQRLWVLASAAPLETADSGSIRVTARTMSIVNRGAEIWFQASRRDTKSLQMQANPRVALCWNNVQIEGQAVQRPHALAGENAWFRSEYSRVHPASFAKWSTLAVETVWVVLPQRIVWWKYLEGEAYRDYLLLDWTTAGQDLVTATLNPDSPSPVPIASAWRERYD